MAFARNRCHCGGTVSNLKLSIDAFQIKSTIALEAKSIQHTIAKFVVQRDSLKKESVLTQFLKVCYSAINPVVHLIFYSQMDDTIDPVNVENLSLTQLLQKLSFNIFNGIAFQYKDQNSDNIIEGTVNLYMLAFGSLNLNLVGFYPGVRFVWGPAQLIALIGKQMMNSLLNNKRFRIISIFPQVIPYDQLAELDPNFEPITIAEANTPARVYYALKGTIKEILQCYLAKKNSLQSRNSIEMISKTQGQYSIKFIKEKKREKKRSQKRKYCPKLRNRFEPLKDIDPRLRRKFRETIERNL